MYLPDMGDVSAGNLDELGVKNVRKLIVIRKE